MDPRQHLAHAPRVADHVVLLVCLQRAERRSAAKGMRVVGEPPIEGVLVEVRGDVRPHAHRPERHIRRGKALGQRDQVRDDPPVIHREPAPGAAEPRHDLVAHHQDPVAVAQRPHALEVSVGRDQDAVGAGDGLEQEGGDRRRTLELDRLVEVGQRRLDRVPAALDAVVRVQDVNDAAATRSLVGPAPRIARGLHRGAGRAMVGAVAGQDLRPPRDRARDLDRVLVRLRPAEGEEHLVDVAREERRQPGPQPRPGLVGHEGADVRQRLRLALDRFDDPPVAVACIDGHQLAVEVEEPSAVRGVEVDPLGARDGQGLEACLGRPVVQRVAQAELGDLLRGQGLYGLHHHVSHRTRTAV